MLSIRPYKNTHRVIMGILLFLSIDPVVLFHYKYGSILWMKTVWFLISWLLMKPADLDLHWFYKKLQKF